MKFPGIIAAMVALLLVACSQESLPTYTPAPTYTPYPNPAPLPAYTPYPTLEALPTLPPMATLTPLPTYTPYPTPQPAVITVDTHSRWTAFETRGPRDTLLPGTGMQEPSKGRGL